MRYAFLAIGAALFCSGCGNSLPNCSDDGILKTVSNIASTNLKKTSSQAVLNSDFSLDPYTIDAPIVDTVATAETTATKKVCKGILHLKWNEHSKFAMMSMLSPRNNIDQAIEYDIRPTDDSSGYLINLRVVQN